MTRKKWYLYPLMILFLLSSCTDLDEVNDRLGEHESRIKALEQLVKQANESTSALKNLIDKASKEITINSYEELKDGSGYVLTMSDGSKITLKNGNGASAPAIGMKQENGVYYWTLNGEYLLDASGNKVVARGKDGKSGVTPKLRINAQSQWEVTYDNGGNWDLVTDEAGNPVVATGSSNTGNLTIESNETHAIIVYNGETYVIPLTGGVNPLSISISPADVTLLLGASETFTLSFEPTNVTNKEVIWVSEDDDIATVENGVVTGHSLGTVIISAISTANNNVKAQATVKVVDSTAKLAIEYMAEYNVNPAGNGFVTTHVGKTSGYFNWNQAMDRFASARNFTVDNVGYHLPTYEEWCSIVPTEYLYIGMQADDRINSIERVSIGGEVRSYQCDYRFPGTGVVYAIRFKDSGSTQKSAWRYQFKENPAAAGEKMMEITVRSLVGVSSVTLDDISQESYWESNNSKDIVRRLPAAGYLNVENNEPFYYNEYGHYWSSTATTDALAKFMIFSDFFAYSDYAHEKIIYNTVRLFTNN